MKFFSTRDPNIRPHVKSRGLLHEPGKAFIFVPWNLTAVFLPPPSHGACRNWQDPCCAACANYSPPPRLTF